MALDLKTLGHPELCSKAELHTEMPADYLWWHECAEKMAKTHAQVRCPGCGFWRIWVPKKPTDDEILAAKRKTEVWETVDEKLREGLWWATQGLTSASDGGANHPRAEEFCRRWSEFCAKLGGLRRELEALAEEQQGAGFPWGRRP